ncbi:MAG: hypothetical protein ABIQ18_20340, partial [Umezawaea sp.]
VSTRRTLPFGEVRGGTGAWLARLDKGLVGGTLDNTGLTHIGAHGKGKITTSDLAFAMRWKPQRCRELGSSDSEHYG